MPPPGPACRPCWSVCFHPLPCAQILSVLTASSLPPASPVVERALGHASPRRPAAQALPCWHGGPKDSQVCPAWLLFLLLFQCWSTCCFSLFTPPPLSPHTQHCRSMLGVGPLADMNILPSGGVSPENAAAWWDAGAAVIGMGSNLAGDDIKYKIGLWTGGGVGVGDGRACSHSSQPARSQSKERPSMRRHTLRGRARGGRWRRR